MLKFQKMLCPFKLNKLKTEKGYEFFINSPTNQIFIILENGKMAKIKEKVCISYWEKYDENHTVVRFATSWATDKEDVQKLIELL